MDYENKHREEITRATQLWKCGDITRENLEYIFPELKESEDERIKRALICGMNALKANRKMKTFAAIPIDDCITWLENQGKPKWSWEDKKQCDLLIEQLATLKRTLALDFRNEIKWLKSLKQTMNNEDKKIKEELIELIRCMHDADPRKERWLSWIEKQPIISPEEMRDLLSMDYSKGRYDTITKAVEWLDEHLLDYWGQQNSDPSEFFIEFKKAMEE